MLLAGCAVTPETPPPGTPAAVTYSGEISCADCPGQRLTLTLLPDLTFRLRRTYIGVQGGTDRDVYYLGRWARAQDDGKSLSLLGSPGVPGQLVFVRPDTLRMLDAGG